MNKPLEFLTVHSNSMCGGLDGSDETNDISMVTGNISDSLSDIDDVEVHVKSLSLALEGLILKAKYVLYN